MQLSRKQKIHVLSVARKRALLKVEIERPFKRELKSYFSRQSKRVRSGLQTESIAPLLASHYKRVVRRVSGIRIKQDEDEYGVEDALILLLFGRATEQALRIDGTTRKLLRRSVEIARQELADIGVTFPTQSELNKVSANIFRGLNGKRPGGIAVFETQQLTEKVKTTMTQKATDMIEDAIFQGNNALAERAADMSDSASFQEVADDIGTKPPAELFPIVRSLSKAWVTVGDSKVRPAHDDANFQIVPFEEPFVVMGELLMQPGDTSLGASLENTSGCRCSSVNL